MNAERILWYLMTWLIEALQQKVRGAQHWPEAMCCQVSPECIWLKSSGEPVSTAKVRIKGLEEMHKSCSNSLFSVPTTQHFLFPPIKSSQLQNSFQYGGQLESLQRLNVVKQAAIPNATPDSKATINIIYLPPPLTNLEFSQLRPG